MQAGMRLVLLRVLSGGEKVHLALVNLSEIALWLFGDRLVEGSEVAVGFGIAGFGDKAARTISPERGPAGIARLAGEDFNLRIRIARLGRSSL